MANQIAVKHYKFSSIARTIGDRPAIPKTCTQPHFLRYCSRTEALFYHTVSGAYRDEVLRFHPDQPQTDRRRPGRQIRAEKI